MAEIAENGVSLPIQQYVLWFDVPMDDARGMQRRKRRENLPQQINGPRRIQLAANFLGN